MELALGDLMFDINLLNKPGIQSNRSENVDTVSKEKKQKVISEIEKTYSNKFNFIKYLFISIIISSVIFLFYTVNNFTKTNYEKNISLAYLLRIINLDKDSGYVKNISTDKENINIMIEFISELEFYDNLELLAKFDYNVKGTNSNEMYYLFLKENWNLEINKEGNVYRLKQLINDFKGIASDILENKVIVICDYIDLVSIIELCEKNNLFNSFKFNISKIEDNTLYKFIAEEYD